MKNRDILLYSFFLALLFLFYKGYTFNSWDQAECLPQVYQLLDPSLYANDFFMQEYHKAFTVRFYFVYLVYGLSYLFSVPAVCFVLTVLSLFVSVYYMVKITQHFSENKIAALLAPVFAFFLFFNFTVGGNQIQSNSLIPGTIAAAFAIAGLSYFVYRKYQLSFFLLGVGTLFQPLVTLQLFMVLVPLLIFFELKHIGLLKIFTIILFYLVPASFMLGPIIYRQFFHAAEYDTTLYYEVLYRFRNHLHYLPSLFPVSDYIKFFVLAAVGGAAVRFTHINNRKFIFSFSALVLLGMLIYWLLLEKFGFHSIGKLQWFKASTWVNVMACIALAVFIGNYFENILKINFEKLITPFSIAGSVLLLFVLLNSKMLPVEKLKSRCQVGNYKKSDLTLLHEWIEINIPKDAVILCSPQNTSLICEAKRSQVVQYQSIIHEPFYMLPWYERFKDIYGVSIETADRNDIRRQADELYQTRNYKGNKYKIGYRIDNVKTCKYLDELTEVLYQSGDYIISVYTPYPIDA